jgi:hypothetical protein
MMGILVSETWWGNKTAYFFASSWFFTFHYVYDARSHEHQVFANLPEIRGGHGTVGYVTTNDATMNDVTTNDSATNEWYNEQFLSIKRVCYNERGGILSADVARACVWRVGPSRFD